MVTDAALKAAAADAEQHFLSFLSANHAETHMFSPGFEKKMGKLIRRAKAPIRYRIVRIAVTAVLAIALLFGALFAFSPEVRADMIRWIKDTYKEFTTYISGSLNAMEGTDETKKPVYCLGVIPDGYREVTVIDKQDGKTYIYAQDSGPMLHFDYSYAKNNGANTHCINLEGYTQTTGSVNGFTAEIFLTENSNEGNAIIWQDTESDILFIISAKVDKDALIDLAKTVRILEN